MASLQVPLVINDRIDVAIACGADGAHIGQEDLPVAQARRLLGPNKILGVSCKTVEHALKAEAEGADYIGSGAGMPFVNLVLARASASLILFLLLLKSSASPWSRLVTQRLRLQIALASLQACSSIFCLLSLLLHYVMQVPPLRWKVCRPIAHGCTDTCTSEM